MPLARAVLPPAIADALREDIWRVALEPGQTITEAAVALRFGCARPTARAAIDRLVTEGLLARDAHRAARVPVLSREDIVQLYDARAVVEAAAVGALAVAGSVPGSAVAANDRLASAGDEDGFAGNDIAFHRALVAAQPNGRLRRMHDALMGEVELCIAQVDAHRLLSPREIAAEHRGVLEAVAASDPTAASARVIAHIVHARDRIVAHFDVQHP